MALRYSGQVEIQLQYEAGEYHGWLRGPRIRARVRVFLPPKGSPRAPSRYDEAARRMVAVAEKELGRTIGAEHDRAGRILVSQEFEAPCPAGTIANADRRHRCGRRRRRA